MRTLGKVVLIAFVMLALIPTAAYACPMCVGTTEEGRLAFVQTAVVLSMLPLGIVGGFGVWLRRRSKSMSDRFSVLGEGDRLGGVVGLPEERDHRDGAEEVRREN